MADAIPRYQPNPIPSHAVPDCLTDADLTAVYEDTKSVLQVP